jgi:hypothetical protein
MDHPPPEKPRVLTPLPFKRARGGGGPLIRPDVAERFRAIRERAIARVEREDAEHRAMIRALPKLSGPTPPLAPLFHSHRHTLNRTQEQLATNAASRAATSHDWRRRDRTRSCRRVEKLAKALKVDIAKLLK